MGGDIASVDLEFALKCVKGARDFPFILSVLFYYIVTNFVDALFALNFVTIIDGNNATSIIIESRRFQLKITTIHILPCSAFENSAIRFRYRTMPDIDSATPINPNTQSLRAH